ncbi:MAG TPA: endonuclease III [Chloroflexota bacterium]|nr:endonuclease III [Chloroflexota bacterium]
MAESRDVPLIDRRLREAFGVPRRRTPVDPVEELVSTVLSQHTAGSNSDRALAALENRFPTWDDVAAADAIEVAAAIRPAGLANQKAPRIKAMLQRIREQRGAIDLSFLGALAVDEAMAWLMALPGVGQTTAGCVLLFGLGMPAMPVDTGIARVAARLGVARPGTPSERVGRTLQESVAPSRVYALHVNLIRHARDICRPRDPLCGVCPLNDLCAAFQAGQQTAATAVRAAAPGSRR